MSREDAPFTAAAGEHYVAFRLAQMKLVVAIPRGGSPVLDLLVSSRDGSRQVAVQVKATSWASRDRGRGDARDAHHLEFPLGHKAAHYASDSLVYVFVDLKGEELASIPDVYVVPSSVIKAKVENWADKVPLVRWHPLIEEAEPYRNKWSTFSEMLKGETSSEAATDL
jgi:hypothetical protein